VCLFPSLEATILVFSKALESSLNMVVLKALITYNIELDLAVFKDHGEAFELEWESNEGIFILSLCEIVN
jgi:hypothetical protein